jgi:hypothetical protein
MLLAAVGEILSEASELIVMTSLLGVGKLQLGRKSSGGQPEMIAGGRQRAPTEREWTLPRRYSIIELHS